MSIVLENAELVMRCTAALKIDSSVKLVPGQGVGVDAVVLAVDPRSSAAIAEFADRVDALDGARVVVVSPPAEGWAIRIALDAGADAVVFDDRLEATLATAFRAACTGQLCVPRELVPRLHGPVLSTREKQALGMVVLGFSNAEIAAKLYLAESTVKNHLSSAFRKLGVRSRSEAAQMILDPETGLGTGILGIVPEE